MDTLGRDLGKVSLVNIGQEGAMEQSNSTNLGQPTLESSIAPFFFIFYKKVN